MLSDALPPPHILYECHPAAAKRWRYRPSIDLYIVVNFWMFFDIQEGGRLMQIDLYVPDVDKEYDNGHSSECRKFSIEGRCCHFENRDCYLSHKSPDSDKICYVDAY